MKGLILCAVFILAIGCGQKTGKTSYTSKPTWKLDCEALAKIHNLPILEDELDRLSTQIVLSCDLQTVLAAKKRLVTTATLVDLVLNQSGMKAIFEIDTEHIGALWLGGACALKLDCPTNLSEACHASALEPIAIAFEYEESSVVPFVTQGNDDTSSVSTLLTIEGKLIDAHRTERAKINH